MKSTFRLFLASPGNVHEEREGVIRAVERINRSLGASFGTTIEVFRWETNARPGMGRSQAVINAQAGPMSEFDIFVGILGARFGTPSGVAGSGTEEEFDRAYASWVDNKQPAIMLYFAAQAVRTNSADDARQLVRVHEFKDKVKPLGLIRDYESVADFYELIHDHLTNWLLDQTRLSESSSDLTGDPFVLVSCPFRERYQDLIACVERTANVWSLQTHAIDQSPTANLLMPEVERRIQQSRILVVEASDRKASAGFIELAEANRKALVVVDANPLKNQFVGRQDQTRIEYRPDNLEELQGLLTAAFKDVLFPPNHLRSMIVPESLGSPTRGTRFVIAASPLSWRRATNRSGGYSMLRRTESDYVGIRGIHRTFGQLYGFESLPDQIDPEDYRDNVASDDPMNLYCIASPKANRWTGMFLAEFAKVWEPRLEFRPDPSSNHLRNVSISLHKNGKKLKPSGWNEGDGDRYFRDFGLIVRGPNPFHPDHMLTVLAGRSSLGTQAACTAFTEPRAVKEIVEKGNGINLEDHSEAFWALVSMQRASDDREEAIPASLEILEVEQFKLTSRKA